VKDETLVKIVAIACLTILQIVNLLTAKLDGNIMLAIGTIIGGIAGYEFGKIKKKIVNVTR
jgi:hypothetical protein